MFQKLIVVLARKMAAGLGEIGTKYASFHASRNNPHGQDLCRCRRALITALAIRWVKCANHSPLCPKAAFYWQMLLGTLAGRSRSPAYSPMVCLLIVLGCSVLRLRL